LTARSRLRERLLKKPEKYWTGFWLFKRAA
jgi:hypothetical protein